MTDKELIDRVRALMYNNLKAGVSPYLKKHYCYVMPSPQHYPFQWWWDTCFNIFILCSLGEYEFAKQNLKSLFATQKEDGFVGHMIFWESVLPKDKFNVLQSVPTLHQFRPHMSSLIQPPLVAQALYRIWEGDSDEVFMNEMLQKLKKYFNWLMANRDFDGDGLISIITPFESGLDWKPSFDKVVGFEDGQANQKLFRKVISVDLRNFLHAYNLQKIYKANYFVVKEVLFNTMYILDLKALAAICETMQDNDAKKYTAAAEKAHTRMMEIMYDEETVAFYDVQSPQNKKLKTLTFTSVLPIILEETNKEIANEIIAQHILNTSEFNLPYPIPSVAKSESSFSPDESKFLWRGPTWVIPNFLFQRCLRSHGYDEEANLLLHTVRSLIEKSGFREYYNPFTGEGYGAHDFTWSGLIVDMIQTKKMKA